MWNFYPREFSWSLVAFLRKQIQKKGKVKYVFTIAEKIKD